MLLTQFSAFIVLAYHHQTLPEYILLFNAEKLLSQWQLMDILVYAQSASFYLEKSILAVSIVYIYSFEREKRRKKI